MTRNNKISFVLVALGLVAATQGGCASSAYRKGVAEGYAQRTSDEAKQRYFEARDAEARDSSDGQRQVWYVFDESGRTDAAGQTKAPGSKVAVPITETSPAK